MKVGILTGGGDCPGLNAVIRAVVRTAIKKYGWTVIGLKNGWEGLLKKETLVLDFSATSGILHKGGTILGSSRTNPFKEEGGPEKAIKNFKALKLDALIAIGGDDTLGVAEKLYDLKVPVVGIPKTIDNDLSATETTLGFNTAVTTAVDAIDKLHTTAESHHRVIIVEVMGRHAGWVATVSGLAAGADYIMIPEKPVSVKEICNVLDERHKRGKDFSIIVVAEGATLTGGEDFTTVSGEKDAFGHVRLGGIGYHLEQEIKRCTAIDTRVTILGHVVRGGSPSVFDRVLATRYGVAAVELVKKKDFGKMVALHSDKITSVPLSRAVKNREVSDEYYEMAKIFFG
ncbi:6-phosphofructokinase [Candidatus Altiarchaeota archaeon]